MKIMFQIRAVDDDGNSLSKVLSALAIIQNDLNDPEVLSEINKITDGMDKAVLELFRATLEKREPVFSRQLEEDHS